MKRLVLGALTLLIFVGCAGDPHTVEHAQNAVLVGGYEAALEKCVQAAFGSSMAGEEKSKVQADYDACAAAADQQFGRKP